MLISYLFPDSSRSSTNFSHFVIGARIPNKLLGNLSLNWRSFSSEKGNIKHESPSRYGKNMLKFVSVVLLNIF